MIAGHRRAASVAAMPLAVALLAAACIETSREDAVEETEQFSEAKDARTVAEALRASLQAEDLEDRGLATDVEVLRNAVASLPADPDVRGIVDADGDGHDDDGKLEVRVKDDVACVVIDLDDEVDVTDESC